MKMVLVDGWATIVSEAPSGLVNNDDEHCHINFSSFFRFSFISLSPPKPLTFRQCPSISLGELSASTPPYDRSGANLLHECFYDLLDLRNDNNNNNRTKERKCLMGLDMKNGLIGADEDEHGRRRPRLPRMSLASIKWEINWIFWINFMFWLSDYWWLFVHWFEGRRNLFTINVNTRRRRMCTTT